MTKITIDRALVEQALEALEVYATHRGLPGPCPVRNVEYALRAALAQQAEPVAVAERERIAEQWDGCVTHQLDTFGPVDIGASIRAGELVEPAQQAEPVQEPVAWVECDGELVWNNREAAIGRNLYTAPPQRKPLTKESLLYIYNQLPNWGMDMDSLPQGLEKFARAVEQAHGIKE